LLQDRSTGASVAIVDAHHQGHYDFHGLQKRLYRLIAIINGKKQERREIDIVCRTDSVVSLDFHYGKVPSKLMLHFPSEDTGVIDVSETPLDVPGDIFKEYERALVTLKSAKPSKLVEKLESIAERVPDFYGVHSRLALLYQQEGCFADAAAEYARASEISPRSVQPLLNLASVQIQAADAPETHDTMLAAAFKTLTKALQIKPGSALAYCLTGAAHSMEDSFDQAEQDFRRALELDDEFSAAHLMLANLYIHRQNWPAAIENLDKYLEVDYSPSSDRRIVKNMLQEARFKAQSAEK
jgi:tetratricopeptide (TPR) repeat protein